MNPAQTHLLQTSDGQTYLRQLVKNVFIGDKIIPRFTTRRCLPNGTILPRIRMSKKLRIKLKRHLCSENSSSDSSASLPSTSPGSTSPTL